VRSELTGTGGDIGRSRAGIPDHHKRIGRISKGGEVHIIVGTEHPHQLGPANIGQAAQSLIEDDPDPPAKTGNSGTHHDRSKDGDQ
jgi:hypothetical protein